jgi:hypothetical protein
MVRPLATVRAFCSATLPLAILLIGADASRVLAQEPDVQAPAHIALVDGVAVLERDGEVDAAPVSMPLLAGDRVRTRGGRVEILFADGSTLHLDHHTVVDLQSDELVRLIEGRIRLSIPGASRSVAYRIDGPHGWAQIEEPGEYRVALLNAPGGSELELAVIRGRAELANDGGRTPLRAGERAFVRAAAAPSYAFVVNSAAWDAFDRWSEARRDERLGASAQYLPDEVRPYAASLDRHGSWRDEPSYGRVWYPRVESDWRPYYRGRWANLRPYGWTWVAHDPWGWPTHHYGRWGFSSGAWFWIPGRSWGAAWVSWASAPGYVSWCPLGWNNGPVLQINVNVGRGYDPWRAWTVQPRHHFGRGSVHRNVVRGDRVDARARGAFRLAERAPQSQGYAVPRGSTPIRVAGTTRGRRGESPLYTNLPADQGRMRTDGARIRVPSGARAADPAPARAVPRERTTPGRPMIRSERPEPTEQPRRQRATPEAPRYQPSPDRDRPAVRRESAPRESNPARTEATRPNRASEGARPAPRQLPRYDGGSAPPTTPRRAARCRETIRDPPPSSRVARRSRCGVGPIVPHRGPMKDGALRPRSRPHRHAQAASRRRRPGAPARAAPAAHRAARPSGVPAAESKAAM